jgi:hypothetical protein
MEPTLEQTLKVTKCPVCGKYFCRTKEWAYRKEYYDPHRRVYFCSWKCLRKAEAEKEKKSRKRIIVDQLNLEGQLVKTFNTIDDAAWAVDGTYNSVRKACKNHTVYKGYLWKYNTNDLSEVQRTDTSD